MATVWKLATVEQGSLVVASFHPELVGDGRLHRYLLGKV